MMAKRLRLVALAFVGMDYEVLAPPGFAGEQRHVDAFRCAARMLLVTGVLVVLSGCAAMPLQRFKPVIAPPNTSCQRERIVFLADEPTTFHYVLPSAGPGARLLASNTFETYYTTIQTTVRAKLPPSLQQHKVTNAFLEFFIAVSGEAQLDAQIADGTLADSKQIEVEREAIRKHNAPRKLTHGQMKDFADKVFDLQLKPGVAALTGSAVDRKGLSAAEKKFLDTHPPLDTTFLAYFKAYYHGKFFDRMGTATSKPQISLTIPDSDIAAAETVLLEFLIDAMDPTPVMGDAAPGSVNTNTHFYPGNSTNAPTAYSSGLATYVQIPQDPTACGITTTNAWVLKLLANGASDQAAAVGGLIANTPGGISFGLGVFGKISIGDNQTLSVLVKTAASRVALRATLAGSYWTLRHVYFSVPEP
jgi:hypothetical protein